MEASLQMWVSLLSLICPFPRAPSKAHWLGNRSRGRALDQRQKLWTLTLGFDSLGMAWSWPLPDLCSTFSGLKWDTCTSYLQSISCGLKMKYSLLSWKRVWQNHLTFKSNPAAWPRLWNVLTWLKGRWWCLICPGDTFNGIRPSCCHSVALQRERYLAAACLSPIYLFLQFYLYFICPQIWSL